MGKRNGNTPRVERVIISTDLRGKGTADDPCRRILQVFTLDGEFIAENDPFDSNGKFKEAP